MSEKKYKVNRRAKCAIVIEGTWDAIEFQKLEDSSE